MCCSSNRHNCCSCAGRNELEGIDQKAALLAEEAKRHGEQARQQQAGLAAIAGQAEEAKVSWGEAQLGLLASQCKWRH